MQQFNTSINIVGFASRNPGMFRMDAKAVSFNVPPVGESFFLKYTNDPMTGMLRSFSQFLVL